MSNKLTSTELKLAAILLDMASDKFGSHVSNDLDLTFLPLEERQKLLKAAHEWNGDPEEYDPDETDGSQDFFLMGYLSDRLKTASEEA